MVNNIIEVKNLSVTLASGKQNLPILQDVSFSLKKGRTLGLCGESGSGKSMCAYSIMGLLPHGIKITGGEIYYNGMQINSLTDKNMRKIRGNDICMIFQDPMSALNPVLTIGYQLTEVLNLHDKRMKIPKKQAMNLLDLCGINNPARCMKSYPHELSGGMRQRVMIAMALINNPSVLIADEPTTALDPIIQKQILDLLKKICGELGTCVLFISHDMNVISYLCDEVCILYGGRICEAGSVYDIFNNPMHCYTKAFLGTMPDFSPGKKKPLTAILGSVPMPGNIISGCPFAPRCKSALPQCCKVFPPYRLISKSTVKSVDHTVACHCI